MEHVVPRMVLSPQDCTSVHHPVVTRLQLYFFDVHGSIKNSCCCHMRQAIRAKTACSPKSGNCAIQISAQHFEQIFRYWIRGTRSIQCRSSQRSEEYINCFRLSMSISGGRVNSTAATKSRARSRNFHSGLVWQKSL